MNLDLEQNLAVSRYDRAIFLTAGAGAGKTRVLTERIRRILSEIDGRVLAITFTNRAAEEMALRIEEALPRLDPSRLTVQTIDGFCRRLLSLYDVEAKTIEAMEQLNEGEAISLLEKSFDEIAPILYEDPHLLELLEESGKTPERLKDLFIESYDDYRTRGILEMFRPRPQIAEGVIDEYFDFLDHLKEVLGEGKSKMHAFLKDPEFTAVRSKSDGDKCAYLEGVPSLGRSKKASEQDKSALAEYQRRLLLLKEPLNAPYIEAIARGFDLLDGAYRHRKEEAGVVDFQDLLEKATDLVESGAVGAEGYDHILIDEFQDTNPLQIRFLKALKKDGTLFVVGDRKQSIYGFRGADVEVADAFRDEMIGDGALPMHLINNYRSHGSLVEAVGDLFGDLFEGETAIGHGAGAWAFRGIDVGEDESLEACIRREAEWIVEDIQTRPSSSRALLLWRKRYMPIYEEIFRERGIRYKNVSSDGFFENREIRDLMIAMEAKTKKALSPETLRSPFIGWDQDALYRDHIGGDLSKEDRDRRDRFVLFLKKREHILTPYRFLKELIQWSGYHEYILRTEGEGALANVDKLLAMASTYEEKGCHIEGFLSEIDEKARWEHIGEAGRGGEADIEIATMHGAKGLEYETVYLGHLFASDRREGGLWNYSKDYGVGIDRKEAPAVFERNAALDEEKEEEEARRLLYVAMTRAKNYLFLLKSKEKSKGLMRFFKDIPFEKKTPAPRQAVAKPSPSPQKRKDRTPLKILKTPSVSASKLIGNLSPRPSSSILGEKETSYLAFGTLFHDYAQRAEAPDPALKRRILARAKERGVDIARLSSALDRYDETFSVGKILAREVPFSVAMDGVVLEGFYDQIRSIEGEVAIVDFKTGARGLESFAADGYRLQLGLYGRSYERLRGTAPALYLWTSVDGRWTRVILSSEENQKLDALLKAAGEDSQER